LYRSGDIAALRRINRRGAALAFLFGLFVVVVYLVVGDWLIAVAVGPEYLGAYVPLAILSIAHLLTLWAGTTNVLLTMIGRERDVLVAAIVAVSTNVVLCFLLVPRFGLVGAASGSATSLVVWRIMLSRLLHVRLAEAERS
jgi:O-antigen/teichoic acid export membrane protein